MRLLLISLFALFLSLALLQAGNSFLITLLSVRLAATGVLPSVAGQVMVLYAVGFVIGALYCGRLVARVGHIRAMAVSTSITAMAAISYPLIDSLYFWAGLRIIGGIGAAGLFITIESWLNAVASNHNRSTLFSIYLIIFYLAATAAQLLVGIIDPLSMTPFILCGLLLMASVIPVSASGLSSPEIEVSERMSLSQLYRQSPLGITTVFFSGMLLSSYYGLVPVFGKMTGISIEQISHIMALSVLLAMLFAFPIGRLCDKYRREYILIGIVASIALLSLASGLLVEQNITVRTVMLAVLMGILANSYSTGIAIANDRIDSHLRLQASSALILSYGVGSIIGPFTYGKAMEILSPEALFLGFALACGLLLVLIIINLRHLPHSALENQEDFLLAVPEQALPDFDPTSETDNNVDIEALFRDEMVELFGDENTDNKVSNTNTTITAIYKKLGHKKSSPLFKER